MSLPSKKLRSDNFHTYLLWFEEYLTIESTDLTYDQEITEGRMNSL